ncbi:MAG: chromate resistance protein [Alphaproteobacteria bacterium]|nr:chromate resistance protein [Alphaproteobacteria bacterium]MBV8409573.1 chromate resistance protein [Alphaproteobacteria bacterium]
MNDVGLVTRTSWLLLIHQLPAKPAYARVKVWRRLQALGAVTVKNAVYALPSNEETQEDFAWLAREIVELGGEVLVCEAALVEGLDDQQLTAMFVAARNEDYAKLAKDARELERRLGVEPADAEVPGQVARLHRQLSEVAAIDFFSAAGRDAAEQLITALETRLQERSDAMNLEQDLSATQSSATQSPLMSKVWVTREHVQIDRIASAWLIRRFIDPKARFKFVSGRSYLPRVGEVRFDMFEGEYTHEGDRCTFEVLVGRAGLDDPALAAIGEIIHDIDLKDGKFGREEAAGIRTVMAGIAASQRDDEQRLARGAAVLDDLYESFKAGFPR